MARMHAAAAALLLTMTAQAFPQAAESPFVAMLRKADTAHTGHVARRDIDGPLAEVQREQDEKARLTWRKLAAVVGVPEADGSFGTKAMAEAISRLLAEADADANGAVTTTEIEARSAKEADPFRRDAVRDVLRALDRDGDGLVSPTERAQAVEVGEEETMSLAKIVENSEGLAVWQRRAMDTLFERFGDKDGRISVDDIAERIKVASQASREQPKP